MVEASADHPYMQRPHGHGDQPTDGSTVLDAGSCRYSREISNRRLTAVIDTRLLVDQ